MTINTKKIARRIGVSTARILLPAMFCLSIFSASAQNSTISINLDDFGINTDSILDNGSQIVVAIPTEVTYRYNARGRLVKTEHSNSLTSSTKDYLYDNAGNRKSISTTTSSVFETLN